MASAGLRWIPTPGGGTGLLIAALGRADGDSIAVCTDASVSRVLAGGPGIAGAFVAHEDGLVFSPVFPLRDGRDYLVVSSGRVMGRIHRAAAVVRSTTRVLAIHPTTPVLAENHLRFCVEFSAPMSRELVSRHIHLFRDRDSAPLEAAILPDGLWDRTGRRVTLLLEPGRIKRGLVPNAEAGSVIRSGIRYRLVIDRDCPDAEGAPLAEGAERRYLGAPAVREPIRSSEWTIDAGADRIQVRFERPLDHTLILRCLSIEGRDGAIRGQAGVQESELGWTFVPGSPLTPGKYTLVVDPRLQDTAGNSLHRLFDRDVGREAAGDAEQRRLAVIVA